MTAELNLNLHLDSSMELNRSLSRAMQPMTDGLKLQRSVFEAAVALVDFEALPLAHDEAWSDRHTDLVYFLSTAVGKWHQWRDGNPGSPGARRHTLDEALALACVDRAELGDNVESPGDREINLEDGHRVFEVAARKHLDMSAEEFIAAWRGGLAENRIDLRDPRVLRVARLLQYRR